MRRRTLPALLVLLLAAIIGVSACGGGDDGAEPGGNAPAQTGEMEMDTVGAAGVGDVLSPAADLRATLDTLLGEHALLAVAATQKGFAGDEDFEAVAAALDENGVELSEAIGSVYGDEAGREFLDGNNMWRAHIGFLVDYTVALAGSDKAAQRQAADNLTVYVETFSSFLATATDLPQAALRESITEHVKQLKGQIDAYAAGRYEESARLAREAYEHMVMTGDTLAGAIVGQNPEMFSRR
jgi:hypothetical protein